uniref:Uncharacterized protein n=1 Tax=Oryzias melastigma TaxID=30732 RepID=A0A3B3D3E9_ORYME
MVVSCQNLLSQMKDFEASAEPLQQKLNATELVVQESNSRLHDLTAKRAELQKLQVQRKATRCYLIPADSSGFHKI